MSANLSPRQNRADQPRPKAYHRNVRGLQTSWLSGLRRTGPTQKYAEHAREKWLGPFLSKRPIPAKAVIANSPYQVRNHSGNDCSVPAKTRPNVPMIQRRISSGGPERQSFARFL